MAPQSGQNLANNGTTLPRKRQVRGRTGRKMTGVRTGAGTGIGASANATPQGVMAIEHFGSYIRGAFEGFALANNYTPQQVLNGAKKHLLW